MGFKGCAFRIWEKRAKNKPRAESNFFADGRADRPIPAGTVPYARVTQLPMPDGTVRYADPDFLRADDFHYDGKLPDGTFGRGFPAGIEVRSEEHTSELHPPDHLVCPLLLAK